MALVPYVGPLTRVEPIPRPIVTLGYTIGGSSILDSLPSSVKHNIFVKHDRVKWANKQKHILDIFGHDCMRIIISFLDPVSFINLSYVCKYFYNFRLPDHSDLTIYIHYGDCANQKIPGGQLAELLERNDCQASVNFVWRHASLNYRENVKEYTRILEKIAINYDGYGTYDRSCKICQYYTYSIRNSSTYYGSTNTYYGFSVSCTIKPPVTNALALDTHATPLEDGEIAMGSKSHPLAIIEDPQTKEKFLKIRVNGQSYRLQII